MVLWQNIAMGTSLFRSVFQNEKGETLMSLMIAVGISSVVMLATVEVMRQQKIQERTNEQNIDANMYQSAVQNFMLKSSVCLKNFPANTIDPDNDPNNTSIPANQRLNTLVNGDGIPGTDFQPNKVLGNHSLRVPATDGFVLRDSANIGPNAVGQVTLRLKLERMGSHYGTDITRDIAVAVRTNAAGMIDYCATVAGDVPFDCQKIGPTSPQVTCPTGYKLFSGSASADQIDQDDGFYQGAETITSTDP